MGYCIEAYIGLYGLLCIGAYIVVDDDGIDVYGSVVYIGANVWAFCTIGMVKGADVLKVGKTAANEPVYSKVRFPL